MEHQDLKALTPTNNGAVKVAPTAPAASSAPALQKAQYSPNANNTQSNTPIVRKIIKNGEIQLEVKAYQPFYQALEVKVNEYNGYISQVQSNSSASGAAAQITLRIPAISIDQFIGYLKQNYTVTFENIKADDVSEQYYDLQARLNNARQFEARLLEMVKTKTGNLNDLVVVEEKLNQVREQIEQFEGKLRYFDNLSLMATLTLNIHVQDALIAPQVTGFGTRAAEVWQDSLAALKYVAQGLLLLIIALTPWLVPVMVIAAVIVLLNRFWRKPGQG